MNLFAFKQIRKQIRVWYILRVAKVLQQWVNHLFIFVKGTAYLSSFSTVSMSQVVFICFLGPSCEAMDVLNLQGDDVFIWDLAGPTTSGGFKDFF